MKGRFNLLMQDQDTRIKPRNGQQLQQLENLGIYVFPGNTGHKTNFTTLKKGSGLADVSAGLSLRNRDAKTFGLPTIDYDEDNRKIPVHPNKAHTFIQYLTKYRGKNDISLIVRKYSKSDETYFTPKDADRFTRAIPDEVKRKLGLREGDLCIPSFWGENAGEETASPKVVASMYIDLFVGLIKENPKAVTGATIQDAIINPSPAAGVTRARHLRHQRLIHTDYSRNEEESDEEQEAYIDAPYLDDTGTTLAFGADPDAEDAPKFPSDMPDIDAYVALKQYMKKYMKENFKEDDKETKPIEKTVDGVKVVTYVLEVYRKIIPETRNKAASEEVIGKLELEQLGPHKLRINDIRGKGNAARRKYTKVLIESMLATYYGENIPDRLPDDFPPVYFQADSKVGNLGQWIQREAKKSYNLTVKLEAPPPGYGKTSRSVQDPNESPDSQDDAPDNTSVRLTS